MWHQYNRHCRSYERANRSSIAAERLRGLLLVLLRLLVLVTSKYRATHFTSEKIDYLQYYHWEIVIHLLLWRCWGILEGRGVGWRLWQPRARHDQWLIFVRLFEIHSCLSVATAVCARWYVWDLYSFVLFQRPPSFLSCYLRVSLEPSSPAWTLPAS